MKCDVTDSSVVNGLRQPVYDSFMLDEKSAFKIFSEPETIHHKKVNESVLKTTVFYSADANKEEVSFNGETLTFALKMIKN